MNEHEKNKGMNEVKLEDLDGVAGGVWWVRPVVQALVKVGWEVGKRAARAGAQAGRQDR